MDRSQSHHAHHWQAWHRQPPKTKAAPTDGELLLVLADYATAAKRLLTTISRIEASGNFTHPLSAEYDSIRDARLLAIRSVINGVTTRHGNAD